MDTLLLGISSTTFFNNFDMTRKTKETIMKIQNYNSNIKVPFFLKSHFEIGEKRVLFINYFLMAHQVLRFSLLHLKLGFLDKSVSRCFTEAPLISNAFAPLD